MYEALFQGTGKAKTHETQPWSSKVTKESCGKSKGPTCTMLCGLVTFSLRNSVSPIFKEGWGPNDLRSFQQKYSKILALDSAPVGQKTCLIDL